VIKSKYVEEDVEEDLGQDATKAATRRSDVPLDAESRGEPQVGEDVFAILKDDRDEPAKQVSDKVAEDVFAILKNDHDESSKLVDNVDGGIGLASSPSVREVVVLAAASSAVAGMFVMIVGWCFLRRSLLSKAKNSLKEDMMEWALHYEPEDRQLEAMDSDVCPPLIALSNLDGERDAQRDPIQPEQSEQQVFLQTESLTEQEANLEKAVEELVDPSQPDPEVQLLTEQEANLHMAVADLCNQGKGGKGEKGDDDILSGASQFGQEYIMDPESEPEPYSD
jgi:hypothetical protein